MILIPAIDIKNNNCVRLKRGNINKSFIFSKNSLIVINKWLNMNLKRLHIVDLDAAFLGKPKNLLTIKNILNYTDKKIEIQVGGGIRSWEVIDYYFNIGVSYIILGTKAVIDLEFFKDVCNKYKEKIILALDLKKFKIAINGWKNYYNLNLFNFLKKIFDYSIESVIYTDTERDGSLKGLNIKNFLKISNFIDKPIIMSGGLSNYKDIKTTLSIQKDKLLGIICGTSIYKGNLNFKKINEKINYFNKIYMSTTN